jgi:hypothetical protein
MTGFLGRCAICIQSSSSRTSKINGQRHHTITPLQVKHTVDSEVQSLSADGKKKKPRSRQTRTAGPKSKFNRLDMQISAMQRDSSTFCDDPEDDPEQFAAFCAAFEAAAHKEDVQRLLKGNAFMAELHTRLVPLVVSEHAFWQRYFFRCASRPCHVRCLRYCQHRMLCKCSICM